MNFVLPKIKEKKNFVSGVSLGAVYGMQSSLQRQIVGSPASLQLGIHRMHVYTNDSERTGEENLCIYLTKSLPPGPLQITDDDYHSVLVMHVIA